MLLSTEKLKYEKETLLLPCFNFSYPISTNPVGVTCPASMMRGVPSASFVPHPFCSSAFK